jgi:hypothetical protein
MVGDRLAAFGARFLGISMTGWKLRKSRYSSTRAKSRADQDSFPSALVRLMRSKVFAG